MTVLVNPAAAIVSERLPIVAAVPTVRFCDLLGEGAPQPSPATAAGVSPSPAPGTASPPCAQRLPTADLGAIAVAPRTMPPALEAQTAKVESVEPPALTPGPASFTASDGTERRLAPVRGFRFDELGMFGEIGVAPTGASAILSPAPLWFGGRSEESAAPAVLAAALKTYSTGGQPAILMFASAGPTLGGPESAAPCDGSAVRTATSGFTNIYSPPSSEPEPEPVSAGAPASRALPERSRLAAATPTRVALHVEGDAVALLVGAAPLAAAEREQIWRQVDAYARELGVDLRELHLNGHTSGRAARDAGGSHGG